VLKRFTTDPINVSKTMFTALDLVSVQTQTRVQGRKIRRNKVLTEINHYDPERDEINVTDVHTWRPETDEFTSIENPRLLEEIQFDRGWTPEQLDDEVFKRRVVLAYLIANDLNEYAQVAATVQAFMNDQETVLALIARDRLGESLETLRKMESVLIDIDPEKEALVPRPDPDRRTRTLANAILAAANEELFERYASLTPSPLVDALPDIDAAEPVVASSGRGRAQTMEADGGDEGEPDPSSVDVAGRRTDRPED
jgi:flagellar protein FlaI